MRYGWLLVACLAVMGCKDKGDPQGKAPKSAASKSAASAPEAAPGTKAAQPASLAKAAPTTQTAAPRVIVPGGAGKGGDIPAAAKALSGSHTIAFFGIEKPHEFVAQIDKVIANLPPASKAEMPELLRNPAGRQAILGFDPSTEAGWRAVGVDPNGGVGVVFDDRVEMPLLMARITDRKAALQAISKTGGSAALGAEVDGLTPLTMDGKTGYLGSRGGYTLLLPPDDAEKNKAAFAALLKPDAPLSEDSVLKRAFSDGVRGLWLTGYVSGAALARYVARQNPGRAKRVQFYVDRFEAMAMSMGQSGGTFRLLGSAKGVAALRQLFTPMGAVPQFAKHISRDRVIFRVDLNLAEFFDGLLALIPEEMAQPRSMVLMGKNALPMAIGVTMDQLAKSLTGHFAATLNTKAQPGQPPIPVVLAGVKDGKQLDAMLKTLTDMLKTRGKMPISPGKIGGRDGYVLDGPLKMGVVRTDELLFAGPLTDVEAALAEKAGLTPGVARMVDGLNMFGFFLSFEQLLGTMQQGPAAQEVAAMIPAAKAAWGDHLIDGYLSSRWLVDGRGVQFGQGPTALAMPGILAAVAIPAFMKYIRRSKSSEAFINVAKLSDSAVAYAMEERADPTGKMMPKRFPPTTPRTPAKTACDGGSSSKHLPQAGLWSHPGWQALNFAIEDPFYYQYEFVSDATSFTARAIGDLDCDGVLSTFERSGRIDAQGEVTRSPLRRVDELE